MRNAVSFNPRARQGEPALGGSTPQYDYEALLGRLTVLLEGRVALSILATALVAAAVLFGARLSGVPMGISSLFIALGFAAFYGLEYLLCRADLYRPWMRYLATVVDVTVPTLVIYGNAREHGALFALLGGGPPLYLLAACSATLRLSPRICLLAGLLGAAQYAAVTLAVVIPAGTSDEAHLLASQGYLTLIKASYIAVAGVFGAIVTSSIGRLVRRLVWSAVDHDRLSGDFNSPADQQLIDRLVTQAQQGERSVATVCSVRVRGFARLAEARPPQEVVELLTACFEQLSAVVSSHGGVVVRTEGPELLCVFPEADDATRAWAAAQQMVELASHLSVGSRREKLSLGVGLHRGELLVGALGGVRRHYTFLGEAVTLATGLQELTRRLGPGILVTESVRATLPSDDRGTALGWFEMPGHEALVEVFGPAALAPVEAPAS